MNHTLITLGIAYAAFNLFIAVSMVVKYHRNSKPRARVVGPWSLCGWSAVARGKWALLTSLRPNDPLRRPSALMETEPRCDSVAFQTKPRLGLSQSTKRTSMSDMAIYRQLTGGASVSE